MKWTFKTEHPKQIPVGSSHSTFCPRTPNISPRASCTFHVPFSPRPFASDSHSILSRHTLTQSFRVMLSPPSFRVGLSLHPFPVHWNLIRVFRFEYPFHQCGAYGMRLLSTRCKFHWPVSPLTPDLPIPSLRTKPFTSLSHPILVLPTGI
jgi:hypothetical protein